MHHIPFAKYEHFMSILDDFRLQNKSASIWWIVISSSRCLP